MLLAGRDHYQGLDGGRGGVVQGVSAVPVCRGTDQTVLHLRDQDGDGTTEEDDAHARDRLCQFVPFWTVLFVLLCSAPQALTEARFLLPIPVFQ